MCASFFAITCTSLGLYELGIKTIQFYMKSVLILHYKHFCEFWYSVYDAISWFRLLFSAYHSLQKWDHLQTNHNFMGSNNTYVHCIPQIMARAFTVEGTIKGPRVTKFWSLCLTSFCNPICFHSRAFLRQWHRFSLVIDYVLEFSVEIFLLDSR